MHPNKKRSTFDPSQNFMERLPQPLDAIFLPKTVAIIGAKDTPGSVGRTIMHNLISGEFGGKIFPVNPHRSEVFGLKVYPNIGAIPEVIDLAVIATPAKTVPTIIKECAEYKVRSVIIISAGFKELGASGIELERQILQTVRTANIPLIGPNCLGVMNPVYELNATFAKGMALKGNLAFISQSGALCTAVLDWSLQEKIGFSSFVSIGSMADIGWGALIDYLGDDPNTESILIYMETIGDARSFLTAAREIALEKPIIVIKAGKSSEASKAVASHTGSLTGSDEVFDAALERVGVLRVDSINELFNMASVLGRQPRPKGPRLAIITNAGGPAVLATDTTILNGAELASLDSSTIEALNPHLPAAWSHSNPVDLLGDAGPQSYALAVENVAKDPHVDGILSILTPQDMTDSDAIAQCLVPYAHLEDKPMLASWMGGQTVKKGAEVLSHADIPVFAYPDDAAKTFATMWRYSQNIKNLYQLPSLSETQSTTNFDTLKINCAKKRIEKAKEEGRYILTEAESKELLACYEIPVVETHIAHSVEEALDLAKKVGYPVVLKLFSETITHKTDVGGVKLNLLSPEAVKTAFHEIKDSVSKFAGESHFQGVTVQRMIKRQGYELILGSSVDPQFGPVILFGMGGQLVEVFKDRALALPPLTLNLAKLLMEKTKIYTALKGVRGRSSVDLNLLEQIIVRFSQMIAENPSIKECDINPLLASPEEIIALDSRVILFEKGETPPKLAIRPYPSEYVVNWKLKDERPVVLRPIKPEDESLMIAFHKELSENSVRQRYFAFISLSQRTAHERLTRICFNDYDREISLIAELTDPNTGEKKIIGVGRLIRLPGTNSGQYKVTIADAYQHLGLGTKLLNELIEIAKNEKITKIYAHILTDNVNMIKLCKQKGFTIRNIEDSNVLIAELQF